MTTTVKYMIEAQERVDNALDALTRMEVGNPNYERAVQELEDALAARKAVQQKWLRQPRELERR